MSNLHHDRIVEFFHGFLDSNNRSGILFETMQTIVNYRVDFGDLHLFDADEARKEIIDRKIKKSIPASEKIKQIREWIKEDKEFAEVCEVEKVQDWELSRGI